MIYYEWSEDERQVSRVFLVKDSFIGYIFYEDNEIYNSAYKYRIYDDTDDTAQAFLAPSILDRW